MTDLDPGASGRVRPAREPRPRRYLMTPPSTSRSTYAINPWMDPAVGGRSRTLAAGPVGGAPADLPPARPPGRRAAAGPRAARHGVRRQRRPGHPDGHVIGARFAFPQRAAEAEAYADWLERARARSGRTGRARSTRARATSWSSATGSSPARASAPPRPRTPRSPRLTGLAVVSLELVDPRFYHLDTALAVLDDETVAYYPGAFSAASQADAGHHVPGRDHRDRGRRARCSASTPSPTACTSS